MSVTIYAAAAHLQKQIRAPAGAVNTLVQTHVPAQYIRVLVDPMYWQLIGDVPKEFEGYRVIVEKREPALPQSHA